MFADRYDYNIESHAQKDFIDYPYSHFDMWEKLSKNRFIGADFATYPRGRLLFDVKQGKYLLYSEIICHSKISFAVMPLIVLVFCLRKAATFCGRSLLLLP